MRNRVAEALSRSAVSVASAVPASPIPYLSTAHRKAPYPISVPHTAEPHTLSQYRTPQSPHRHRARSCSRPRPVSIPSSVPQSVAAASSSSRPHVVRKHTRAQHHIAMSTRA
eukprot:2372671-Rhodomonas_salina.1